MSKITYTHTEDEHLELQLALQRMAASIEAAIYGSVDLYKLATEFARLEYTVVTSLTRARATCCNISTGCNQDECCSTPEGCNQCEGCN